MKTMINILFVLVALQLVGVTFKHWGPMLEKANQEGPNVHFYTQEAYDHCEKMSSKVRAMGSNHWTCHDPKTLDEGPR